MTHWITMTREEIYALVWQRPMSRLAAEHSISDVGLSKICARHDIPTPPRGYWAKVEAGHHCKKPPLPPSKDSRPIQLRRADVGEQSQRAALTSSIAQAKSSHEIIPVCERLSSPCSPVREAKVALEHAAADTLGFLQAPTGCLDLRVSREQLSRALRVADALIKSLEDRGWPVTLREDATLVNVDSASIAIALYEETITAPLPAKPPTLKPGSDSHYSFHYSRPAETVRRPSGALCLEIRPLVYLSRSGQLQRRWRDSEKRSLEGQLGAAVVGMLKLAAAVRSHEDECARIAAEAAERQRQLQLVRDQQSRLREALLHEKANVEQLCSLASRWRQSRELRSFIHEVSTKGSEPELRLEGCELEEWLRWSMAQADRLDPFTPSPPSILDDEDEIENMVRRDGGYR